MHVASDREGFAEKATVRQARAALHLLASCAMLLSSTPAAAQIDPADYGLGTKLGMSQRNNSGQVGTVTLFERSTQRTLVVVHLFSVSNTRDEVAQIRRAQSCDVRNARTVFALSPVVDGISHTVIGTPAARLLSGNYVVDVRASAASTRRVSCGELHR